MTKPKAADPTPGHNIKTAEQKLEEQVLATGLAKIREGKSEIGEIMSDLNSVYERLKHYGFTKKDIKWALDLDQKDSGEVLEEMRRRVRIAEILGHGFSRQVNLFDEDRTPIEERAYQEGYAAGLQRKQNSNAFDPTSKAGQEWQRGFNEGTATVNADLSDAVKEAAE